jgi:tetratricopeptide (TPR) repeat protein
MQGLLATVEDFALLLGDAICDRRPLDLASIDALTGFRDRYAQLLKESNPEAGLLALGQELYAWLDGTDGRLRAFLRQATRPLRFEIRAADCVPTPEQWALLRAPWELLADSQGFLAQDAAAGFSPVRRLGQQAPMPTLGEYRLGLAFMAASPAGAVDLDYEAEEAAIIKVIEPGKLDLLVEESGNPHELGDALAAYPLMQVVHLSCHGHNAWSAPDRPDDAPKPVLFMETLDGGDLQTDAGTLVGAFGAHPPRLVFLSACLSAATSDEQSDDFPHADNTSVPRNAVAYSLAEALVDAGVPAVLGWNGSVADVAATAFAARLYDELADQADLADAVALARRDLLNSDVAARRSDWHLPRLWLGPQGGGPLVGGRERRPMMPATHGGKAFLIKEVRQAPVASHEMFVGRRRELQEALQVLEAKDHIGVLLTGMGRLGKSSLAARIANRRRDLRLAVVFGQYDAAGVLAALSEALKDHPRARDLLRTGAELVRSRPETLAEIVKELLSGPCAPGGDGAPLLLVIDDLDQVLLPDPEGGRHQLAPGQASALAAVLEAFDAEWSHGPSRLVVTSRYRFSLHGLENRLHEIQLPPLSEAAQSKLRLRQREAAADSGLSAQALEEREALLERAASTAKGNPGLQDLLGRRLFLSGAVPLERAEQALAETETWLEQGELPSEAEVRDFLRQLDVDELIGLAGDPARETLRCLTLFEVPVPQPVMDVLIATPRASQARLHDLGLIDISEDLVSAPDRAFAVNALVAGRLEPLSDEEEEQLTPRVTQVLLDAWGGQDGGKRPSSCDLQLLQLGLLAEDSECVAACATDAIIALPDGPAANTVLGQAAIALLDVNQREVSFRLISETAAALIRKGDGAAADDLLARGLALLEEERRAGVEVDAGAAKFLVYEQAQRKMHRGELGDAESLFEEVVRLAMADGDELSAVVARGSIANLLFTRGEFDEALRIRQEEELPTYERLGAIRSRAIVIGEIADIMQVRGDVDEALRIRLEEQLPVFERLGDIRGRAAAMGQIAGILRMRGDLDEAMRIHLDEELPVYEMFGEASGRAATLRKIGDIDAQQGRLDEAWTRYEQALEIIGPLNAIQDVALIRGAMANLLEQRGELDEALRLHREEELPVYQRLGDVRACAIVMGQIADILQQRGELGEALRIRREEELPVYQRLGDIYCCARANGRIADLHQARGDLEEVLRIRRDEELPAYQRLGDLRAYAIAAEQVADILQERSDFDEALHLRQQQVSIFEQRGEIRDQAQAVRSIGDIDVAQGRLGDAIARYEQGCKLIAPLGVDYEFAVLRGCIARVLLLRGDLDEALRIYREEELPIYERFGDIRSRAITMGQIADILQTRGALDEVLRIRREEELPVYDQLGDLRARAVTLGQIADVLESRAEWNEALRVRRDEELPAYEQLGDDLARAMVLGRIADIVTGEEDYPAARALQQEQLDIYRQLSDAAEISPVLWNLAQLDLAEDKREAAVPRLIEAYDIEVSLDRADGIATIGMLLGRTLAARGDAREAGEVLRRTVDVLCGMGYEEDARQAEGLLRELGAD